jgi:hypothetical protein
MAARDYGDMTAQERIERQIRILDECIASLLDNEVRKYRESLGNTSTSKNPGALLLPMTRPLMPV